MHEMVSRAAKHVFSRFLRKLPLLEVPACVAHMLNCLLGFGLNTHPQPHTGEDEEFSSGHVADWASLDAEQMRELITREVFKRYRYRLQDEWWSEMRFYVLLREVCLKLGFQLMARDYQFQKTEPLTICTAKAKKAVNGTNGHKEEETTFYPEDILNVVPVIKEAPVKVWNPNEG